jgi:hypothetical protein
MSISGYRSRIMYGLLVPTLMIDDAETKMRTESSVLFELKTSVPFCHPLQICELIYVDIYLARSRQVLR